MWMEEQKRKMLINGINDIPGNLEIDDIQFR